MQVIHKKLQKNCKKLRILNTDNQEETRETAHVQEAVGSSPVAATAEN